MKPDHKTIKKYPEVGALSNYGFLTKSIRKLILASLDNLQYGRLKIMEREITTEVGKGDILVSAEIQINDPSFYLDVFTKGSIGAAESYILKKWDTSNLDNVMRLFALNKATLSQVDAGIVNLLKPARLIEYWQDRNTIDGSKKNIKAHYDLPDELFEHFLDESMMYSSAFFENDNSTLEEAQQTKLRLIGERLDIRPESRILEIGTGWGALAIFLAKNYDCHVTTTTISDNQYRVAKERISKEGLEDKITLLKDDYRILEGEYDRVVSIEMIEAVGEAFLDSYTKKISDLLVEDGFALLQIITINDQEYDRAVKELDFIKKFIFPGSFIPSIHAVLSSFKTTSDMRLYSQVDFTSHYARTLEEWRDRFNTDTNKIPNLGEDEEFIRLWNFYFSYCIGGFYERAIGVSHLTFGKPLYRN